MEMKSHSTHEEYCWHCDNVEPMTVAVNKGQEDQLTGNDGNDRWLAAYPRESRFRNKADCICFVYVCNRCGYPTVERREYNNPRKGSVGEKADLFIFAPHSDALPKGKQLEAAYNEVLDCFSCKAYKATVIMARSVLENIINKLIDEDNSEVPSDKRPSDKGDKRPRDKGLKEKIQIAEDKGVIPKLTRKNAKAIKSLGDSSTHNITKDITKEEANAVIELLKDVVRIYKSRPERKQVTKKAWDIRKQRD